MPTIKLSAIAAALAVFPGAAAGAGNDALTIYSNTKPGAVSPARYLNGGRPQAVPGYAVVRHERPLALEKGRNMVRFSDVAALIDPTTVSFESLTDPAGTSVIEQNFQFDLVSTQKLLERYVDRRISVDQVRGTGVESFAGTLLSTKGGLTLKRDDGSIQLLPHNAGISLPELPGGLITRPTLVWDIAARQAATHRSRVSYQTSGITWWADYNLKYMDGASSASCTLDVGAWVSILNRSGASYQDAGLKLVAGDVQRATHPASVPQGGIAARAMAKEERVAGFEQKAFFEYHLYTLGRRTTLPDNSTKQIELFPVARRVPCEKTLVYYGAVPAYGYGPRPLTDRNFGTQMNRKVDVYLQFRNAKRNHLGQPLPAGRMRVSKLDPADATLEFIGEDAIDHTPQDEQVRVKLGSAFDVVGERRQMNFNVDTSRRIMTEEIEVKLRNHKKEAVTVIVKENLYRWINWEITEKTHAFKKEDSRTVHFPLKVPAGGETVLRYTVHYSW